MSRSVHSFALSSFAVLALLLALPQRCLADTYEYQYTGGPYTYDAVFTFTTDALITSETTVTPTSCSYNLGSGTIACDSIEVDVFGDGDFYLEPTETYNDAAEIVTGFSLTDVGTQSNIVNSLTITDIPSPTPEPASIALLCTGLIGIFAALRRRRLAEA